MNKNNEIINTIIYFIILFIIGTLIRFTIKYYSKNSTITSPVESIQIDSVSKENYKLILEVEHLDSIKDAKIIEIKSLDNDSTLKLFYQLIRQ